MEILPRGKAANPLVGFLKENTAMVIAFAAAAVTTVFVPIDRAYLGYIDFKTLTCLFCVLAVVCALKDIRFFTCLRGRSFTIFEMRVYAFSLWSISRFSVPC